VDEVGSKIEINIQHRVVDEEWISRPGFTVRAQNGEFASAFALFSLSSSISIVIS
jgi:hypothetical protein